LGEENEEDQELRNEELVQNDADGDVTVANAGRQKNWHAPNVQRC
jgi:hypothetical protein